jgi:hypothetical protein
VKFKSEIICSTEMLSRFMDNELAGDGLLTVQSHVTSCESCRERLDAYGKIRSGLNSFVGTQAWPPGQEIEAGVINRIRQKEGRLQGLIDLILSKRTFIPAGLAVSLALVFMVFFNNPVPSGPSAIISSLSGTGSSIMIMETVKSRQTILWVKENG